jgi:hypothetical protein
MPLRDGTGSTPGQHVPVCDDSPPSFSEAVSARFLRETRSSQAERCRFNSCSSRRRLDGGIHDAWLKPTNPRSVFLPRFDFAGSELAITSELKCRRFNPACGQDREAVAAGVEGSDPFIGPCRGAITASVESGESSPSGPARIATQSSARSSSSKMPRVFSCAAAMTTGRKSPRCSSHGRHAR